jgi:hypothetical protein
MGGMSSLLPFTDEFTRDDGDLANGWDYTAGKWTIVNNSAVGTPAVSATNVVVNGTFDTDTDWSKGTGWTIADGIATKAVNTGSTYIHQLNRLIAGQWYQANYDAVLIAGSFSAGYWSPKGGGCEVTGAYIQTGRAAITTALMDGYSATNGSIDNFMMRQITLVDMFCTRDLKVSDIDLSAACTLDRGTLAGIVICLDSIINPLNYIYAIRQGNMVYMYKVVNGTSSSICNGLITYGDGKELRIVKSGMTIRVYYDSVQVGADVTVEDAGIISNTRHGMFSSHPNNSFAGISVVNP